MTRHAQIAGQISSSIPKQLVLDKIDELITAHFKPTLRNIKDINKLVMALIYKESSFDAGNVGISYGPEHIAKIKKYSCIQAKLQSATPLEVSNIENSARAYGLMQVTGYYAIKGASPTGIGELERMHGGLCASLTVPAGTNVYSVLSNGMGNLHNQILTGLTVLEAKYLKAPALIEKGLYSNITYATFGSYLGSGKDGNGTTPEMYCRAIIYGDAYRRGNAMYGAGDGSTIVLADPSATGPQITDASGKNQTVAGC